MPVSSSWLAERGVSPQLAYRYVKGGWLQSLSRGVFAKPGGELDRDHSLRLLAQLGHGIHVGGKTALAWQGFIHNLSLGSERLVLFRGGDRGLPGWFTSRFRCRVSGRKLFEEDRAAPLYVTDTNSRHPKVPVSEAERAMLEMLSDVPHWQGLDEAKQLMEGLVSLRAEPLRELLNRCVSVKTVRLFLQFARQLDMPVLKELPADGFRTGSKSRYVRKLPHGTLVLKP